MNKIVEVRSVAVCAFALALSSFALAKPAATVDTATTEANIARATTALLESSQLSHHPLDAQLASKLLDRYLDALDGAHALFFASDVDELAPTRATLAQATRSAGDTRPAHAIYARYLERLRQQVAYDAQLLRSPASFDFTGHDRFQFDREKAARPRDAAAAHELWREALRAEYLEEKLGEHPPADIPAALVRRHEQQLKTMAELGPDEVLEIYLDALTHVYDPHSDYLGKESMESLSIAMNLSLFGIGATLTNEDGACTIRELVPGGPAALSGALGPGDRIVAVEQASGPAVDVSSMPLSRIVELIRGPKGSPVTLTVLPPTGKAGAARTVHLVRDEVKLEDQQAKARIVDLPAAGGALRLGVVDLPSFYSGEGAKNGATADVARLLRKLEGEHVRGLVLDLRRNGGGSLEEAINLTGLFIRRGPVVQTRDAGNSVEVGADRDPSVAYPGPLVVLTSRFSASASEILAGALQDYGRAVIVGDTTTFGKGTVQTILPLASIMDKMGMGHAFDPGAVKLTISKFYRPSGGSTELRGVASDILVPSPSEVAGIGESKLVDPLPWDTVPAAPFDKADEVAPYLARLRTGSTARLAADPGFVDIRREVTRLQARLAGGAVSLNEAERRRELADEKRLDDAIGAAAKHHAAEAKIYEITVKNAGRPGLPAPMTAESNVANRDRRQGADDLDRDSGERSPTDELIEVESLRILADYVHLHEPPPSASVPAPRNPS
jgi:carboxyl-terminal processing protease